MDQSEQAVFQHCLFKAQLEAEDQALAKASFLGNPLIVVDRGLLDYKAFSSSAVWASLEKDIPTPLPYSQTLFLNSVAVDREHLYETSSNPVRCHSAAESKVINKTLLDISLMAPRVPPPLPVSWAELLSFLELLRNLLVFFFSVPGAGASGAPAARPRPRASARRLRSSSSRPG